MNQFDYVINHIVKVVQFFRKMSSMPNEIDVTAYIFLQIQKF